MICCFFGHRECPDTIREPLRVVIEELIKSKGANTFYVGHQGGFDRLVISLLQALKKQYSHISYAVVLAYMPNAAQRGTYWDNVSTLYPDGLETAPKRFAISWRNRWMVKQADMVVVYVTHGQGGAAQFAEYARKQGKEVVNLAESVKQEWRGRGCDHRSFC